MSESRKEGQRTGRGDERAAMPRRLRSVSAYPDPFLVTKLPLEGRVSAGVIRLGDRTILGFVEDPFPDGSRVRVVYQGWLMAELLELEEPASPVEEQPSATGESAAVVEPRVEGESQVDASPVEEQPYAAGEAPASEDPRVEAESPADEALPAGAVPAAGAELAADDPRESDGLPGSQAGPADGSEVAQHGEPFHQIEDPVPPGEGSPREGPGPEPTGSLARQAARVFPSDSSAAESGITNEESGTGVTAGERGGRLSDATLAEDADDYPLERGPLGSDDAYTWEQVSRGAASRNGSMRAGGETPATPTTAAQREQESVQPDLFPDDLTESEGGSSRSGGDWVDAFSRKREHE